MSYNDYYDYYIAHSTSGVVSRITHAININYRIEIEGANDDDFFKRAVILDDEDHLVKKVEHGHNHLCIDNFPHTHTCVALGIGKIDRKLLLKKKNKPTPTAPSLDVPECVGETAVFGCDG